MNSRRTSLQVVFGILCLFCGIAIYLLFRSDAIRLYQWFTAMGVGEPLDVVRGETLQWAVPEFIKYSLPDGLYCTSYILLMDAVWRNARRQLRMVASSVIPLVAVVHELLQGAGVARGPFDWRDLLCYALPLAAYLLKKTIGDSEVQ